ncbi:MAG: SDR family oxidoreductase, partial [Limnochordaceae bacterium]|nr:SDR family oxidoreductase [Limnochordaceae bacterium]
HKIEFIQGDIRDLGLLRRAFAGAEVIFHEAALPSVPRSIADPLATNENNIDGTLNVLVAAKEMGVKRVVIAASSSAYGDTERLPKVENMPANPLSPYAVTKYVGELYGRVFSRVFGLETVSLRYFNVFGPRQDPASQYAAVIPKFILAMLRGEQPLIHGDGNQSRDFTYVDNVVEANLLAAKVPGIGGEVFNIGCGARFTLNELVAALNRILGTRITPRYGPPRPGDVRHSLASIEKAGKLLGYRPTVGFEAGLKRTVDWFVALDGEGGRERH